MDDRNLDAAMIQLVDVVFALVAALLMEPSMTQDLVVVRAPPAHSGVAARAESDRPVVRLQLDRNGRLLSRGQALGDAALASLLESARRRRALLEVSADPRCPWAPLATLKDRARELGLTFVDVFDNTRPERSG